MPLFKYGKEINDDWQFVDDDTNLPRNGPVIVSLARWRDSRDELIPRPFPTGVALKEDEFAEEIEDDLIHLALVQVFFPTFADGRAFSTARTLRERYGFKGEIRATGDVLLDQLQFMHRCGIDALNVTNEPTVKRLRAGNLPGVDLFYQPARDGRTTIINLRRRQHPDDKRLAS